MTEPTAPLTAESEALLHRAKVIAETVSSRAYEWLLHDLSLKPSLRAIEAAARAAEREAWADKKRALVEALRGVVNAMTYTVTNITSAPMCWCHAIGGTHDATCSGMLRTMADAVAALAAADPPATSEPTA